MVFDLNGVRMRVVKTAAAGVVNFETIFQFEQDESGVVSASYSGGGVIKGFLVGKIDGNALTFRYCQADERGRLDGGVSDCELERTSDGRIRPIEHFRWESRDEVGENIFEEIAAD